MAFILTGILRYHSLILVAWESFFPIFRAEERTTQVSGAFFCQAWAPNKRTLFSDTDIMYYLAYLFIYLVLSPPAREELQELVCVSTETFLLYNLI